MKVLTFGEVARIQHPGRCSVGLRWFHGIPVRWARQRDDSRTTYRRRGGLPGRRDDGYKFHILYYILTIAVLGIIMIVTELFDVFRLARRRKADLG